MTVNSLQKQFQVEFVAFIPREPVDDFAGEIFAHRGEEGRAVWHAPVKHRRTCEQARRAGPDWAQPKDSASNGEEG